MSSKKLRSNYKKNENIKLENVVDIENNKVINCMKAE